MTPQQAKFILRAHRADGRYAPDDPVFAEALAEAARSPELTAWLEHEHALDATVAHKLDAIQPPPGLRETILAGARVSRVGRRWWQNPFWLVAAAAIAVVASVTPFLRSGGRTHALEHALVEFALRDSADKNHQHGSSSAAARAMFAALRDDPRPLTSGHAPDFEAMRQAGCKRFELDGHEIFEVCVVRDSRWFHLYVARRDPAARVPAHTTITERGSVAVASWSTATTTYTLASPAGRDALRALI